MTDDCRQGSRDAKNRQDYQRALEFPFFSRGITLTDDNRATSDLNREDRQDREEKRSASRSLWYKGKDPSRGLTLTDAVTRHMHSTNTESRCFHRF